MSALMNYERLWNELEQFDRQIRAGSRLHLPTFHRTVKAIDAAVAAICQARESSMLAKPSRDARQCYGKRRFGSFQSATHSLHDHDGPARSTLTVYKCAVCRFFHLGNSHQQHEHAAQTVRRTQR